MFMIIAIKGEKKSGKTAFIEKLLEKLRGYKIIVIKSSEHERIDEEGKDTFRYREAGAVASIIVARNEIVLFSNENGLDKAINLAKKLMPDLIIVEGYESVEKLNCRIIEVEKEIDIDKIYEEAMKEIKKYKEKKVVIFVDGEELPLNKFVEEIFYKTMKAMLSCLRGGEGKEIEIMIRE
ncbi:MAG: molybdopterin-guanine dinucleotide biosynthesis protein B [Thermoplasmata archaeon]|nr:MAG: molybdopterin-guanine dinucleotide biosynthesis protein B [Thermoplasmata archaeon]